MGGGDLNTKKSWHPSTLKNQERVWKAEQAVAEEKKRIIDLQREREQEHDHAQLSEMAQRNFGASAGPGASQVGDNRLHWMYDKPEKQVQHEDYLLGKEIGKSDESERAQNAIPAVSRRVVGSSMIKSLDDTQVDLARKMREDPLLLVKERERAARAALLNNPLQRKRLAELLRKEKEQKESKQKVGKTKKKSKKKDKNLDDMLAAKLNALGGEKGIDLSSLLNSNDSSSESSQSSDEKSKKKKKRKQEKFKKKSKKSKKKKSDSDTESSGDDKNTRLEVSEDKYKSLLNKQSYNKNLESNQYDDRKTDKFHDNTYKSHINRETDVDNRKKSARSYDNISHQSSSRTYYKDKSSESRKRRSDSYGSEDETKHKKIKREYAARNDSDFRQKRCDSPDRKERSRALSGKKEGSERRQGLSEAERAAKLAEMAAAGKERETERGIRVARQRADDAAETSRRAPRSANNEARALPDSLESRIRSNRHYIQRDKMHMDQHFARR